MNGPCVAVSRARSESPPGQRLLPLEPSGNTTFETFIATGNEVAVEHLKRLADGDEHRQIYLWGEASSGKSHLLQAACSAMTDRGGRSAWLPLPELLPNGPGVLVNLEGLDLVALDGLDAVTRSPEWQTALFDLINEARIAKCRLVMAGECNPAGIGFRMKDLPSRLTWGAVYRLAPLDDAGKAAVLRRVGERLGCALAGDAPAYLLANHPRDLAALVAVMERLAVAAKQRKRRVTVPFIKEVLPAL